MKPEFTYLLVVRQGAKRIAIAGTNSGGCLAGSETVFNFHGLKGDATWGEVLEKQKNYAGRSPDFRAVELSQTEQDIHWFRLALASGIYKTWEHFVGTHPDAETHAEPAA